MATEFLDSHAHLDDPAFNSDRSAVIERAWAAGVTRIVTLGVDVLSSKKALAIADEYPSVFVAVGIHPHEAASCDTLAMSDLRRLISHRRVVAIGETGLDYYRDRAPRDAQREAFRAQLRLAGEAQLPVAVHDREAHEDVLILLAEEAARRHKGVIAGVMHCFSGEAPMVEAVSKLGLHISFAGSVTYRPKVDVAAVVRAVPDDRLLVETDCPYLTPQPRRGRRNEPAHVVFTYQAIAELRSSSVDRLAKQVKENAIALFGNKVA